MDMGLAMKRVSTPNMLNKGANMLHPARSLILLLILATCLWTAPTAWAQSNEEAPLPAVFAGTVEIDNVTPEDRTPISALIDGVAVATTTVTDGSYAMPIPPSPQTRYSGKTVVFHIDGMPARETATWVSDGGGTVNLSYRSPTPSFIRKGVVGVNTIITDEDGMPLYTRTHSPNSGQGTDQHVECSSDECLANWTPLQTAGQPVAGADVDPGMLGIVEHSTKGQQATYNGWPLYLYQQDSQPGMAKGQGNDGEWWVVSTDGKPVSGAGSPGPMGPEGKPGTPGTEGPRGASGPPGPPGAPGSHGTSGIDGQDGLDGRDGIDGKDGSNGAAGPPGPPGPQGEPGPQGPAGETGSAGLTGLPGEVGTTSITGDAALIIATLAIGFVAVPKLFGLIKRRRGAGNDA